MSCPEADERNNCFDQPQDEVDVAQGDEAPDPPLEDDPEHQEDAAAQRNLTGPRMLLEEHQRGQQLGQSVHGQEGESGRDEILEQEVRPGHLGVPPQPAPVGSIHIIAAPPTAPMAMKRVNIFRNVFMGTKRLKEPGP